jgi:Protein of unknown function (DUF3285)
MTEPSIEPQKTSPETSQEVTQGIIPEIDSETATAKPQGSYVKLAMQNMVRKRGTSLKHFFLTTFGVLGLLVALAYLTR